MHPIDILKAEHEEILKNLDALENVMGEVRDSEKFGEIKNEVKKLEHIAHVFLEAESHYKREEDVLFPLIEKHGIEGPTQVMRMEHEELRKKKKELENIANSVGIMEFNDFISKLEENGGYILSVLREHISKENNILYPMAMDVAEEKEWKDVRKKFDKIGYCCFSPKDK